MTNTLITMVVVLLAVGIVVWGIKAAPIIDATFKQVVIIAIYVCTALWFLFKLVPLIKGLIH